MYQAKNFDHLLGLTGFSDILLKNHFTLYQGYVNNVNKLNDRLTTMLNEGKVGEPEYAELKRRFGWEYNGMKLHEYYFGNMKEDAKMISEGSELAKKIKEDFGNYDSWLKDFKGTGGMRGIGWVLLYYSKDDKKLYNVWVNEHDLGHLAGAVLLLVLDVFEHAYITDYGIKRADYLEAFVKAIDWEAVENRFKKA